MSIFKDMSPESLQHPTKYLKIPFLISKVTEQYLSLTCFRSMVFVALSDASCLQGAFGEFGQILRIDLERGQGFLEFDDKRDADDAIKEMDGHSAV